LNEVVARSSVLGFLLALLAVTCTACGAGSGTGVSGKHTEPIAAKVGTDVITAAEVDNLLGEARTVFRERGRLFPAKNDPYYADLRDEAIRYLVESTIREQFAESIGLDVSEPRRNDSLNADTYRAIAQTRQDDETVREALARNRRILEERFAKVTYAPGFEPAEHRRSVPPELRSLPKPKASCDLKAGTYPYLEARAHGCLDPRDDDVKYFAPQCPEIPARESDPGFTGFTAEELDSGYGEYVTSGTAGRDFFEPLTTNLEDLASAKEPEGPVCQPFPGYSLVSVGDVGFRSIPHLN
jgi:hypothetical protein